MTSEDKIKLSAEYQKWALNYVIYTYFADPVNKTGSKIHNSATTTFVDTGKKKLAITNAHVIEEFKKLQLKEPDINYQLGSLVIPDILNRIVSKNSQYDLATYEITEKEINSIQKQFCLSPQWPPDEIKKDELLLFAGYPGIFRDIVSPGRVKFESIIILDEIISTSPESFKILLDTDNYERLLGKRTWEELSSMGGCSGAGVFRINDKKKIATLEPVGVIFEGSNFLKIQKAAHFTVIDEQGIINVV
jgi:hypothetical protein